MTCVLIRRIVSSLRLRIVFGDIRLSLSLSLLLLLRLNLLSLKLFRMNPNSPPLEITRLTRLCQKKTQTINIHNLSPANPLRLLKLTNPIMIMPILRIQTIIIMTKISTLLQMDIISIIMLKLQIIIRKTLKIIKNTLTIINHNYKTQKLIILSRILISA